jgi:type IV pilus assembly protein PilA
MSEAAKKSGTNVIVIVIVVVLVVILAIVAIVGVLAAMGIFGARRYIGEAKKAEGKAQVAVLARGIAMCTETAGGKLPASSAPVPAALSDVSGKKYQSDPKEWSDPAFTCASFSMLMPQYFQYQWVQSSDSAGTARAVADFDGDGTADVTLEAPVACAAGKCTASPTVER